MSGAAFFSLSFPRRRESRVIRVDKIVIEIFPLRITFFDEAQFPRSIPLFDLPLFCYRGGRF